MTPSLDFEMVWNEDFWFKTYIEKNPIQSISRDDLDLSFPCLETPLPMDWRHLVKECFNNLGIPLDIFMILLFQ